MDSTVSGVVAVSLWQIILAVVIAFGLIDLLIFVGVFVSLHYRDWRRRFDRVIDRLITLLNRALDSYF